MPDETKSNQEIAIENIMTACKVLGWNIAVPETTNPDADVPGLILGTDEYMNKVISFMPEDITF